MMKSGLYKNLYKLYYPKTNVSVVCRTCQRNNCGYLCQFCHNPCCLDCGVFSILGVDEDRPNIEYKPLIDYYKQDVTDDIEWVRSRNFWDLECTSDYYRWCDAEKIHDVLNKFLMDAENSKQLFSTLGYLCCPSCVKYG